MAVQIYSFSELNTIVNQTRYSRYKFVRNIHSPKVILCKCMPSIVQYILMIQKRLLVQQSGRDFNKTSLYL